MRTRLGASIAGLITLVILSALGMRSCNSTATPAIIQPSNVARTGVSGLCANQQAVAAANGGTADTSGQPLLSDAQAAQLKATDPAGYAALSQASGGSPKCPPPTNP